LKLPEGFEIIVEPWPYGGLDKADENRRFFQGLIFAIDGRNKNPDSNFYPFPLPIIPVMDFAKREIIRIEELATGGNGDALTGKTHAEGILDHCRAAEYVPELLPGGTRTDLKELNVVQPNGPSFSVTDESLVEWQKWRFRVSFNPREGAVLHDICYDGRSVLYRLAISEMVCIQILLRRIWLTIPRLFLTLILVHHSTENKHSILVTEALDMQLII
jgi:primary-amine oxidase